MLLLLSRKAEHQQLLPRVIRKQQQRIGENQSCVETDVLLTAAPLDVTSQSAGFEWQPTS